MTVVLRNTQTGEYKQLDSDSNSAEYQAITRQLRTDGYPMWEETGQHDYQAFLKRLENDALRPEDIGDEGQPVTTITGAAPNLNITPSGMIDRSQPTATELASDAGRAADGEGMVPTEAFSSGPAPIAEGTPPGDGSDTPDSTPPLTDPSAAVTTATHESAFNDSSEMEDDDDEPESPAESEDEEISRLVNDHTAEELKTLAEEAGVSGEGTKTEVATRIVQAR